MIGWCMIVMAVLVHAPVWVNAIGGVAIIALHNVADFFPAFTAALRQGGVNWLWKILYLGGAGQIGEHGPPLISLYVLVPWIGVTMAVYAFGAVMRLPAGRPRASS